MEDLRQAVSFIAGILLGFHYLGTLRRLRRLEKRVGQLEKPFCWPDPEGL